MKENRILQQKAILLDNFIISLSSYLLRIETFKWGKMHLQLQRLWAHWQVIINHWFRTQCVGTISLCIVVDKSCPLKGSEGLYQVSFTTWKQWNSSCYWIALYETPEIECFAECSMCDFIRCCLCRSCSPRHSVVWLARPQSQGDNDFSCLKTFSWLHKKEKNNQGEHSHSVLRTFNIKSMCNELLWADVSI